ncbi:MAG TPA: OsmC family protein [Prosthecobacter sp.]
MSRHLASIRWNRTGPDFLERRYSREHAWYFDGGAVIPASSSPSVVPAPWSNAAAVDPEEAFVASVSSCHMLWFLHLAVDGGHILDSYQDNAEGFMTKNEDGVPWISRIVLRPQIQWSGENRPSDQAVQNLHHEAHRRCFIAASIRTEVVVD